MHVKIPKNQIERIAIVKTDCKLTLKQVVEKYKPDYAINGGLYSMKTGKVSAIHLRIDGKTVAKSKRYGYWMLAWNEGPDIRMIHSNDMEKWQNAVACSAMLMAGDEVVFHYTTEQGGVRGRTGFGDDRDNVHLFVTTDTKGPLNPESLRKKMKSNGCQNAIMMDCGGSSQMYYLGKYLQAEKRKVAYWILVWLKRVEVKDEPKEACPYTEPNTNRRMGNKNEGVKWLQWHLQKTVAPEMVVDGAFGAKTLAAVIEFQKKYKIAADGIVGKATRTAMKNALM